MSKAQLQRLLHTANSIIKSLEGYAMEHSHYPEHNKELSQSIAMFRKEYADLDGDLTPQKPLSDCIQELMLFYSVEDKETLLMHMEDLLVKMDDTDLIISTHADFSEAYSEYFPQYVEREKIDDLYDGDDLDDCDPAGGYGLHSHV